MLVSRPRDLSHNSPGEASGWLRCSPLKYSRYSRVSRLAIRAPRSGIYATNYADGTLEGIDVRSRRSKWFASLARSDHGGALVELAMCLPLLVLILVGTADFARVFYTSIELTNAARAAAQAGAYGLAQSDPVAGPMQATANTASNITPSSVTVLRSCSCVSDDGSIASPMSCTAVCPTSPLLPRHRVITVTVTTGTTFSTISSLLGVPCRVAVGGCALSRSATLRVSE